MTPTKMNTTVKATVAISVLFFSLASRAELPQGEFACQVQTVSGQAGLVLVQTEIKGDAVRVAQTARALNMDGSWGKSLSVVECIKVPGEEFKDSWFNDAYKKIPR